MSDSFHSRYEILSQIGTGAYGNVYKGRNIETKQIVAIKQVYFKKDEYKDSMKEVETTKSINHDNIVKVYELIEDDYSQSTYIILEYADYDLYSVISHKKDLNINLVAHYMRQILQGVHALRISKILHRDLKPANILVTRNNKIIITDFGIARFQAESNNNNSPYVGTLYYTSPEQLLGAKDYSYSVDIWSTGCIFYELLSGEILFDSQSSRTLDQLYTISTICGSISSRTMKNFSSYSGSNLCRSSSTNFSHNSHQSLFKFLSNHPKNFPKSAINLLCGLLALEPTDRLSPEEALNHPFFSEFSLTDLPSLSLSEAHHNPIKHYNHIDYDQLIQIPLQRILPPPISVY